MKKSNLLLPLVLSFFMIFVAWMSQQKVIDYMSLDGKLDLTTWNSKSKIAAIKGQWAMKNSLENIIGENEYDCIINFTERGNNCSKKQYLTYQMKIKLPMRGYYSLYVENINSPIKVFVDQEILIEGGSVSNERGKSRPASANYIKAFRANSRTINLTIQSTNQKTVGRNLRKIYIGTEQNIRFYDLLNTVKIGYASILLFLFLRASYKSYRTRKLINQALYTLSFSTYILLVDVKILSYLAPDFPWEISTKIAYLSFILPFSGFIRELREFYPDEINKYSTYIINTVVYSMGFFVLLSSSEYHKYTGIPWYIFMFSIYTLIIIVLILAIIRKRSFAGFFFTAYLIMFLASLNDMLLSAQLVNSYRLTAHGMCVFAIISLFIITQKELLQEQRAKKSEKELTQIKSALKEEKEEKAELVESIKEKEQEKNELAQIFYLAEAKAKELEKEIELKEKEAEEEKRLADDQIRISIVTVMKSSLKLYMEKKKYTYPSDIVKAKIEIVEATNFGTVYGKRTKKIETYSKISSLPKKELDINGVIKVSTFVLNYSSSIEKSNFLETEIEILSALEILRGDPKNGLLPIKNSRPTKQ